MEPLRVEIVLSSAMTEPEHPIHLDALVAWAAVDDAREKEFPEPLSAQDELPFDQVGGVWCASALLMDYASPAFTVALTKRTDLSHISDALQSGDLKSAPNKLNLNSGPFRQSLYYNQCRHVRKASAWCVADRERLQELLGRINYLGAKRRNGRGRVSRIEVFADDTATTRWRERILPTAEEGYLPIRSVVRPPYWDRSQTVNAWAHPNVV